ncbi:MAG: Methyltransferase type 12 [Candidatus Collierbacteria bacterium GW2011_GWB1_44_6]|uniref:Methyltransferase type 12 n=2 Tax=Candidatus Collieribacteriota TaxID=1752725 RepID=A0A0G1MP22_9BACT|nr:MAG: Methyltransferase type 12 [Candidatus Collierbacteria bacterium GW2011_GWC2_43_12]KKT73764.1 MAG: Methyltransferase type 12 [Candidatus Collierbacteria bacterium GW2011_GWB1_44_6]KKT83922.1 MAG: Methyltransferase type 12 [Microgenomates group bacterium GW2011_GWC1_44_9]
MVIKREDLISKIYFPGAVLAEGFKKGQKVLDIGCATGNFLKKCDAYGMKTYGVDISSAWLKKAKTNTKARLKVFDLNSSTTPFPTVKFDLITAFDVIEHLDSPSKFVEKCYSMLKKGGKLIITTPNLNSFGRYVEKNKWHGYSDKTHKYLFTIPNLEFILSTNNFKITKSFAPFHPLPLFIQSFINKLGLGGQIWIVGQR